jgi:hypothetical protein
MHLHSGWLCVVVGLFGSINATTITNDEQAYAHCQSNKQAYIAIVWPIAQGNDTVIQEHFKTFGSVWYRKNMYFTPKQALYLLRSAHPHIRHMNKHLAWYFPPGTFLRPARIFIVHFADTNTAIACKYAIRKHFNLQYRSIHINDTHTEALELARFFFKK